MIRAKFYKRNGLFVGFYIVGHSGYKDSGSDIVCSAVSAISQATLMGLVEKASIPCCSMICESGKMFCITNVNQKKDKLENADLLIGTMNLGLLSIERSYGKYLSVSEREVTDNDDNESAIIRT